MKENEQPGCLYSSGVGLLIPPMKKIISSGYIADSDENREISKTILVYEESSRKEIFETLTYVAFKEKYGTAFHFTILDQVFEAFLNATLESRKDVPKFNEITHSNLNETKDSVWFTFKDNRYRAKIATYFKGCEGEKTIEFWLPNDGFLYSKSNDLKSTVLGTIKRHNACFESMDIELLEEFLSLRKFAEDFMKIEQFQIFYSYEADRLDILFFDINQNVLKFCFEIPDKIENVKDLDKFKMPYKSYNRDQY